jgi:glycosyltransferase involved in cell wall biosynthesis
VTKKTLQQLYASHTGKVSDKWSIYLTEYDRIFNEYRDKPVRLLEIGIQNGGSLEIWSKFFSSGQKFLGCDINPYCSRLSYVDPRINVVIGDVNTDSVQSAILEESPTFDLIIDDGSHRSSDIVLSFVRYFPCLEDGGMFVVEDLHCSYWQEFEGALFDPFSSLTFFKRLSDVVNYEHWGVDKARTDILDGFFSKYGFNIEEETLQHIHSIEFINSMCVIRKSEPKYNEIGGRYIAGTVELVEPGHSNLHSKPGTVLDQTSNEWSTRSMPPDEELLVRLNELDDIKQKLAEREELIANIFYAKNWNQTAPVRVIKRLYHASVLLSRRIKRARIILGPYLLRMLREPKWGLRMTRRILAILYGSGWQVLKKAISKRQRDKEEYQEWIHQYDTLTDDARTTIRNRIDTFEHLPLISVVMPVYNPNSEWLVEAIESVRQQIYPNWELCIADDASTDKEIRPILEDFAARDSSIKVVFREKNGHISATSNSALELVSGEWVALLDHDDLLHEHALFWVADAIKRNSDIRMIYSDEDKIDSKGERFGPYFKCDWNIDLFLSQNMFSHLGVYETSLLREVNGFQLGLEGSQDYDLALRCIERIEPAQIHHIPRVLYHWRVHKESTAHSTEAKTYAVVAGERALNDYCQRNGIDATVEYTGVGYRFIYASPKSPPMVSLIIPARNGLHLIRQCIESILEKTIYPNYEILVIDNGSDINNTLSYLKKLQKDQPIKIMRNDRPFNLSALYNSAIEHAEGSIIGLINNDIEVISNDWLNEMVSHACRPEVGAVGARLLYPDGEIQHAGIIMGVAGIAGYSHYRIHREESGYFGRAALTQSYSAVTAACMVVRKELFKELGGFNEQELAVAFNDVDFCLRLYEKGCRNIWTPYAELYHHESAKGDMEYTPEKQERFRKEINYMRKRWGYLIDKDPAYSPNLSLSLDKSFSLAWPPRIETFGSEID